MSYTWSLCVSDGDAVLNSLSGNAPNTYENPYNREYDQSRCSYNATQALRVNGLYDLPFQGNRLVSGWQLSGIWSASTGLPFNITDGVDNSNSWKPAAQRAPQLCSEQSSGGQAASAIRLATTAPSSGRQPVVQSELLRAGAVRHARQFWKRRAYRSWNGGPRYGVS